MTIARYLKNACDMLRNWSLDRKKEKPFSDHFEINSETWAMSYEYLYKLENPILEKLKDSNIYIY